MAANTTRSSSSRPSAAASAARKVRWTVPAVDVSTVEWLDAQDNISQSLRLLIRESIEREGYIDVVNKPVRQLPRRGRPPLDLDAEDADSDADDLGDPGVPVDVGLVKAPASQEQPARQPGASRIKGLRVEHSGQTDEAPQTNEPGEPDKAAVDEAVSQQPSQPSESNQQSQVSIDEIMAATRR